MDAKSERMCLVNSKWSLCIVVAIDNNNEHEIVTGCY